MVGAPVLAVLMASDTSLAVTVAVPAVPKVTLKVAVPPERAASAGSVAVASLLVMSTVSSAVGGRFQFASTALTVTVKAMPACCGSGVPVLPKAVPGAAVSPGMSNCSFANRRVKSRKKLCVGLHGNRFNYLFLDNHVQILKVVDTIGTGTTNAPRGMWAMVSGE